MTTDLEKGDRAAELIYLIPCDHQKRVCFSSRWRWGDLVEILGKRRDDVFVQVLDVAGIVGANYSGWREENQDSGDGTASLTASSEGGILVYCRWSEVAPLRKELAKAGYEEVSVYGLSPGVNDPRLAVPVSTNKISAGALVLYQPSLRRAKLRKLAAYGMSRLGLTRVWAPVAMVAGRTGGASGGGIVSVVRREMGAMASIALFTGTPGPQRKATFAILGPRGEALGFGKIASTPATRALIRNEVKMLRRLETAGMGPEQVPRLLVEGRLEDGAEFVIQSTVKKPLVARTTRIGDVQARFLVDLFERTKAVDPDRGRAIFEDLSGRVGRLAACEAGPGACAAGSRPKRLMPGFRPDPGGSGSRRLHCLELLPNPPRAVRLRLGAGARGVVPDGGCVSLRDSKMFVRGTSECTGALCPHGAA